MTLVITHAKVSGQAAGPSASKVYGTDWDANHTLTGTVSIAQGGTNATSFTASALNYYNGTGVASMTGSVWDNTNRVLTFNGTAAQTGAPQLILSNNSGLDGSGTALLFQNLNSLGVSHTAGYINGGYVAATSGAERGLIDYAVWDGTNSLNRILTQTIDAGAASASFGPSDDNYWNLGLSGFRWSTVYGHQGDFSAYVKTGTVATTSLPAAAGNKGIRYFVSDASAATFGSTFNGGGANNVPVYSDGTNWRVG